MTVCSGLSQFFLSSLIFLSFRKRLASCSCSHAKTILSSFHLHGCFFTIAVFNAGDPSHFDCHDPGTARSFIPIIGEPCQSYLHRNRHEAPGTVCPCMPPRTAFPWWLRLPATICGTFLFLNLGFLPFPFFSQCLPVVLEPLLTFCLYRRRSSPTDSRILLSA